MLCINSIRCLDVDDNSHNLQYNKIDYMIKLLLNLSV